MKLLNFRNNISLFLVLILFFSGTAFGISITKSLNDKREYRTFSLSNQLQVLLISDASSDKSAASMDVNVGQFNDPAFRPGLAHFCEHMLFLGTKKYPEAGEYQSYLTKNGGYSNAYTGTENTNYHFLVNSEKLEGALDRFAQFFIAPLFTAEFVEREKNAVDSEFRKNLNQDNWRQHAVFRATSNPKHPFSRFSIGNLETLSGKGTGAKNRIRTDLIKFYQDNYSANLMKLVVLGRESLDQQEEMVRKYFAPIVNRNLKPFTTKEKLLNKDELQLQLSIVPVKDLKNLELIFPLPAQRNFYNKKPLDYISHLLGHEGKGSLLSLLKSKGWVNFLGSGRKVNLLSESLFSLNMELTEEGLSNKNKIIDYVFQYIRLINKKGINQKTFNEIKKIADIEFQYQPKEEQLSYVTYLSSNMQKYPLADILTADYLLKDFDPLLIRNTLNKITPQNMRIHLTSKKVVPNRLERWFKVKYRLEKVPAKLIAAWEDSTTDSQLMIPTENPFVPENVEIKPKENLTDIPILIRNNSKLKVWFKQDSKFNTPKGRWNFILRLPEVTGSIEKALMNKLYVRLIKDSLNESSYPAILAGLNYSINPVVEGIEIKTDGYSDKLPLLLNKIFLELKNIKISDERFSIIKKQLKDKFINFKFSQSYQQAGYEMVYLQEQDRWHINQYLKKIDEITPDQLRAFIPKLIDQLRIELLVTGNFTANEVELFSKKLEQTLIEKAATADFLKRKLIRLTPKQKFVRQLKGEDQNNTTFLYYQAGAENTQQSALIALLETILQKPFYHQLRTVEQLGYIVWSEKMNNNLANGFIFVIQSPNQNPVLISNRIGEFLTKFQTSLDEMQEDEFNKIKQGLILSLSEKSKNLEEETKKYWDKILNGSYEFQYNEKLINKIKTIKKSELVEFYNDLFIDQEKVKRISVQIFKKGTELEKVAEGETLIKNPVEFREEMDSYQNEESELD